MKTYNKKSGNHSVFFDGTKVLRFLHICNQKADFNKYFTTITFS